MMKTSVLALTLALVLACCFLGADATRLQKLKKTYIDTLKDEIINLKPKAEYNTGRRVKYSVASTVPEDLVKVDDCDPVFAVRDYLQPTKVTFSATAPALPSVGTPASPTSTTDPAILVISSSKPKWLSKMLLNTNVADTTDETDLVLGKWVPWYSPFRTGRGSRKVYIMVHHGEFEAYKTHFEAAVNSIPQQAQHLEKYSTLVNNVRIIGCKIEHTGSAATANQYIGFGLNRFCGMMFMKKIGQNRFWMVDDNILTVGGITDNIATLEAKAVTENVAVLGFKAPHGEPPADDALVNSELGLNNMNAVYNTNAHTRVTDTAPTVEDSGNNRWLEQLYLFDMTKLSAGAAEGHFRSFSPRFVLSKEDLTFSADLVKNAIAYKLVNNGAIYKVLPQLPKPNAEAGAREADLGFNRDFTILKQAIRDSVQTVRYGDAYGTTGTWTQWILANPKIGAINIKGLNEIGGAATDLQPSEDWFMTVIKTQEIVMFKCAQKGIGADGFNFDAVFQFNANIAGDPITMVRLTAA